MKKKQLKDFKSAVKQIASYKPEQPPGKPEKAPSAKQLKQSWKLEKRDV